MTHRVKTWAVVALAAAAIAVTTGADLHWQQLVPPQPNGWEVWSNLQGTPTRRATILASQARNETVTPLVPPWYPTAGPGTPTPQVEQHSISIPSIQGGELVAMNAYNQSGVSVLSNVFQLNTETPTPSTTPTVSATATVTDTQTPTLTATLAPTRTNTAGATSTPTVPPLSRPTPPHMF